MALVLPHVLKDLSAASTYLNPELVKLDGVSWYWYHQMGSRSRILVIMIGGGIVLTNGEGVIVKGSYLLPFYYNGFDVLSIASNYMAQDLYYWYGKSTWVHGAAMWARSQGYTVHAMGASAGSAILANMATDSRYRDDFATVILVSLVTARFVNAPSTVTLPTLVIMGAREASGLLTARLYYEAISSTRKEFHIIDTDHSGAAMSPETFQIASRWLVG